MAQRASNPGQGKTVTVTRGRTCMILSAGQPLEDNSRILDAIDSRRSPRLTWKVDERSEHAARGRRVCATVVRKKQNPPVIDFTNRRSSLP